MWDLVEVLSTDKATEGRFQEGASYEQLDAQASLWIEANIGTCQTLGRGVRLG